MSVKPEDLNQKLEDLLVDIEPFINDEYVDKWFAMTNNDPNLLGTRNLEGGYIFKNVCFILDFLNSDKAKEIFNFSPEQKRELELKFIGLGEQSKIVAELQQKRFIQAEKSQRQAEMRQDLEDLVSIRKFTLGDNLQMDLTSGLYDMAEGRDDSIKEIEIPTGYAGKNGAHAVTCTFRYEKGEDGQEDKIIFLIRNTGGGLHHHATDPSGDKLRKCPVHGYEIPLSVFSNKKIVAGVEQDKTVLELEEQKANVKQFLINLFKPKIEFEWSQQLDTEEDHNADTLYKGAIASITGLLPNSKLIEDPFKYTKQKSYKTIGQYSGSCSEKSLHCLIEDNIGNKENYKRAIYSLKKYSILRMLATYKRDMATMEPAKASIMLHQMKLATENLGRLLDKIEFRPEEIEVKTTEAESLHNIKQFLVEKVVLGKEHETFNRQGAAEPNNNEANINRNNLRPEPIPGQDALARSVMVHNCSLVKVDLTDGGDIVLDLNRFLDLLNTAKHQNTHDISLLKSIEEFMSSMPLPPEVTNYHCDDPNRFCDAMERLRTEYQNLHSKVHANKFDQPEFFTTNLSMLAVSAHVLEEVCGSALQPETRRDLERRGTQTIAHQIKMQMRAAISDQHERNPLFGNARSTAKIDKRFKEVKNYLDASLPGVGDDYPGREEEVAHLQRYLDIINSRPGLKNNLERIYDKLRLKINLDNSRKAYEYRDWREGWVNKYHAESMNCTEEPRCEGLNIKSLAVLLEYKRILDPDKESGLSRDAVPFRDKRRSDSYGEIAGTRKDGGEYDDERTSTYEAFRRDCYGQGLDDVLREIEFQEKAENLLCRCAAGFYQTQSEGDALREGDTAYAVSNTAFPVPSTASRTRTEGIWLDSKECKPDDATRTAKVVIDTGVAKKKNDWWGVAPSITNHFGEGLKFRGFKTPINKFATYYRKGAKPKFAGTDLTIDEFAELHEGNYQTLSKDDDVRKIPAASKQLCQVPNIPYANVIAKSTWSHARKNMTANSIQVDTVKGRQGQEFNEDIIIERKLYNLRLVKEMQLAKTIEYCDTHIDLLFDKDTEQEALFAHLRYNIFEPGVLEFAIEKTPHLLCDEEDNLICKFFARCFNNFQEDGNLNKKAISCLEMEIQIYSYIFDYCKLNPIPQNVQTLEFAKNRLKTLQVIINSNLEKENEVELNIELHRINLNLAEKMIEIEHDDINNISSKLCSLFYFKAREIKQNDAAETVDKIRKEEFSADTNNMVLLDKFSTLSTIQKNEVINKILDFKLGEDREYIIDLAENFNDLSSITVVKRDNPNDRLNINLAKGLIYKNNLSLSAFPAKISTHPVMQMLFANNMPKQGWQSNSENYFEFEVEEDGIKQDYRIIDNRPIGNFNLQKKIVHNGVEQWPEYVDTINISDRVKKENFDLPATMTEAGNNFWVSGNHIFCENVDNNQDLKVIDKTTGILTDSQGYTLINNPEIESLLSRIENPRFVEIYKNGQGVEPEYKIKLPRYNLELECQSAPDWQFKIKGTNKFIDLTQEVNIIAGFNQNLLAFEETDKGRKQFLLVPRQKYIKPKEYDGTEYSEFHHLVLDTNAEDSYGSEEEQKQENNRLAYTKQEEMLEIPIVEEKFELKLDETHPRLENNNLVIDIEKLPSWIKDGTVLKVNDKEIEILNVEKRGNSFEFKLSETDATNLENYLDRGIGLNVNVIKRTPNATTRQENLYLAYTYMCNHQPLLAKQTLEKFHILFGSNKWSTKDVELLQLIAFGGEQNNTAEYVPVRLRAMSLLASYHQQVDKLELEQQFKSRASEVHVEMKSDSLREKDFNNLSSFYSKFSENIFELFELYNKHRNNVSAELNLTKEQELILLREIYNNPKLKRECIRNQVGERWRSLEAEFKLKEASLRTGEKEVKRREKLEEGPKKPKKKIKVKKEKMFAGGAVDVNIDFEQLKDSYLQNFKPKVERINQPVHFRYSQAEAEAVIRTLQTVNFDFNGIDAANREKYMYVVQTILAKGPWIPNRNGLGDPTLVHHSDGWFCIGEVQRNYSKLVKTYFKAKYPHEGDGNCPLRLFAFGDEPVGVNINNPDDFLKFKPRDFDDKYQDYVNEVLQTPEITEERFISIFPYLYETARNHRCDGDFKLKLHKFAFNYLKASRLHPTVKEAKSNKPMLCALLAKVSQNPGNFPELVHPENNYTVGTKQEYGGYALNRERSSFWVNTINEYRYNHATGINELSGYRTEPTRLTWNARNEATNNVYEQIKTAAAGIQLDPIAFDEKVSAIPGQEAEVTIYDPEEFVEKTKAKLDQEKHLHKPPKFDTENQLKINNINTNMLLNKVQSIFDLSKIFEDKDKEVVAKRKQLLAKRGELNASDIECIARNSQIQKLDIEMGEFINDSTDFKKSKAVELFQNEDIRDNLLTETNQQLGQLENLLEIDLERILHLANNGPDLSENDPARIKWKSDKTGGRIPEFDIDNIVGLYLQNNLFEYMQKTRLTEEQINILHVEVAKYINNKILKDQLYRIKDNVDKCEKYVTNPESNEFKDACLQLATTTFSKNHGDCKENPELAVFQYYEGIMAREDQKDFVQDLLEVDSERTYKNKIIQLIMGGGKSKVLLPMLAKLKCTGTNLNMIAVPAPLFNTNYADLSTVTRKLFKQDARKFLFNRSMDKTGNEYKAMYRSLESAMINKEFFVTTVESIQSLELKLIEVGSYGPHKHKSEYVKNKLEKADPQLKRDLLENIRENKIEEVRKLLESNPLTDFNYEVNDRKDTLADLTQNPVILNLLNCYAVKPELAEPDLLDVIRIGGVPKLIEYYKNGLLNSAMEQMQDGSFLQIAYDNKNKELLEFLVSIGADISKLKLNTDLDEVKSLVDNYDDLAKTDIDGVYKLTREEQKSDSFEAVNRFVADYKEWASQVKWLKNITKLMRENCDLTIDEVDGALNILKMLNYTVGESKDIPKMHIKTVVSMFKFINTLNFDEELPARLSGKSFKNLLSGVEDKPSPEEWEKVFNKLCDELIESKDSPIKDYITELGGTPEVRKAIRDYFNNSVEKVPACIDNCKNQNLQDALAICKLQLNTYLPLTVSSKKIDENYGMSHNPEKTALQQIISIPYAGNNTPNEKCKHGDHFETLNYTTQIALIKGFEPEVLKEILQLWLEQAKGELSNPSKKATKIDDTTVGKTFEDLCSKLDVPAEDLPLPKLSEINFKDKEQFEKLHKYLTESHDFIFYCLEEVILPKATIEGKTLHSNPHNLVSAVKSVVGMTGTPWNHLTMHQSIAFDDSNSFGTDGITINTLIRKNTKVSVQEYTGVKKFLNDYLEANTTGDKTDLRAIIDVGATFRGVTNIEAVKEIAECLTENNERFEPAINYVLYFDDEHNLCAYDLDDTKSEDERVIFVGSSSEENVRKVLNCEKESLFTYYDQLHTRGTDIKQMPSCEAIATIADNTFITDDVQGVMRLRQLRQEQKIHMVISGNVNNMIKDQLRLEPDDNVDITNVVDFCVNNQNKKTADYVYRSTLQILTNVIRENLKDKVVVDLNEKDPQAIQDNLLSANNFFMSEHGTHIFKEAGGMEVTKMTEEIFNDKKQKLLDSWKKILKRNKLTDAEVTEIEKDIKDKLQVIINEKLRHCEERNKQVTNQEKEGEVETQNEVEQEKEKEKEKEQEREKMNDTARITPYRHENIFTGSIRNPSCVTANDFLSLVSEEDKLFTDGLSFSNNMRVNIEQRDLDSKTGFVAKQIEHVLLIRDTDGSYKAVALTAEDADDVCAILLARRELNIALVTPNGKKILGDLPPDYKEDPSFLSLREQIKFFNGDLESISEQAEPLHWISERSHEKLEYFKTKLQKYRQCSDKKIELLQTRVSASASLLEDVLDKYYKDLTHLNDKISWEQEVGHSIDENEIPNAKKLAKLVKQICDSWPKKYTTEEIDEFIRANDLHLMIQTGFKEFVNSLNKLADIKYHMDSNNIEAVVEIINDNEKLDLLNKVLPISDNLEQFVKLEDNRATPIEGKVNWIKVNKADKGIYIGATIKLDHTDKEYIIHEMKHEEDGTTSIQLRMDQDVAEITTDVDIYTQPNLLLGNDSNILLYAASIGNLELLKNILSRCDKLDKAEVLDFSNSKGQKAIHIAAMHGHADFVLELINNNCAFFEKDNDDKSAFNYAVECNIQDKLGSVVKKIIVEAIIEDNSSNLLNMLKGNKAALKDKYNIDSFNLENIDTLATLAVKCGSIKCLSKILEQKVGNDILYVNDDRRGANVFAILDANLKSSDIAENKAKEILEILLKQPMPLFTEDALHNLVENKHPVLVEAIYARCDLLRQLEEKIKTPATPENNIKIIDFIRANPFVINNYLESGTSPLSAVISSGNEALALEMLNLSPKPNLSLKTLDADKKSALQIAVDKGLCALVEKLGPEKLIGHIKDNDIENVKEMLQDNSSLLEYHKDQQSILTHAIHNSNIEIVEHISSLIEHEDEKYEILNPVLDTLLVTEKSVCLAKVKKLLSLTLESYIKENNYEGLHKILDKFPDLNTKELLHLAIEHSKLECLNVILNKKHDLLFERIADNNPAHVDPNEECCVDVDVDSEPEADINIDAIDLAIEKNNKDILKAIGHYAVHHKSVITSEKRLKALIDSSPNELLNLVDKNGLPPVVHCITNCTENVIRMLLENYNEQLILVSEEFNCLQLARDNNLTKGMKQFIANKLILGSILYGVIGDDKQIKIANNILNAISEHCEDVLFGLHKREVDIEDKDETEGFTPLMYAVNEKNDFAIELILNKYIEKKKLHSDEANLDDLFELAVNLLDDFGVKNKLLDFVLENAVVLNDTDVLLKSLGLTNPNITLPMCKAPLACCAARYANIDNIKHILDKKPDLFVTDENGDIPYRLALLNTVDENVKVEIAKVQILDSVKYAEDKQDPRIFELLCEQEQAILQYPANNNLLMQVIGLKSNHCCGHLLENHLDKFDLLAKNGAGQDLFDLAKESGMQPSVINKIAKEMLTAAIISGKQEDISVVEKILDHGTIPDIEDYKNSLEDKVDEKIKELIADARFKLAIITGGEESLTDVEIYLGKIKEKTFDKRFVKEEGSDDSMPPQLLAIACGNKDIAVKLFEACPAERKHDVTSQGNSAIHLAMAQENYQELFEAVKEGQDVNAVNNNGRTALMESVSDIDRVRYLINICKTDVAMKCGEPEVEAIDLAIEDGVTEACAICIATPQLHERVSAEGGLLFIRKLIGKLGENALFNLPNGDDKNNTPLMTAVIHKKSEIVAELLKVKADILEKNSDDKEALELALLENDNAEISIMLSKERIKDILDNGNIELLEKIASNPEVVNELKNYPIDGKNILHYAIESDVNINTLGSLIRLFGFNVKKYINGKFPLDIAIEMEAVVKDRQEKLNLISDIQFADKMRSGDINVIRKILRHAPDLKDRAVFGNSGNSLMPFSFAVLEECRTQVLSTLVDNGVNSLVMENGLNCLMHACHARSQSSFSHVAEMLKPKYGFDLFSTSEDGHNFMALDCAIQGGNQDIINMISHRQIRDAIAKSDVGVVEKILMRATDINGEPILNHRIDNDPFLTPIVCAIDSNNEEIVTRIVEISKENHLLLQTIELNNDKCCMHLLNNYLDKFKLLEKIDGKDLFDLAKESGMSADIVNKIAKEMLTAAIKSGQEKDIEFVDKILKHGTVPSDLDFENSLKPNVNQRIKELVADARFRLAIIDGGDKALEDVNKYLESQGDATFDKRFVKEEGSNEEMPPHLLAVACGHQNIAARLFEVCPVALRANRTTLGNTALHLSFRQRNYVELCEVVREGQDFNAINAENKTVLMESATDIAKVRYLVETCKADVAFRCGVPEVEAIDFAVPPEVNRECAVCIARPQLHERILEEGGLDFIRKLTDKLDEDDLFNLPNEEDRRNTPLMTAIIAGNEGVVSELLKVRVNILAQNNDEPKQEALELALDDANYSLDIASLISIARMQSILDGNDTRLLDLICRRDDLKHIVAEQCIIDDRYDLLSYSIVKHNITVETLDKVKSNFEFNFSEEHFDLAIDTEPKQQDKIDLIGKDLLKVALDTGNERLVQKILKNSDLLKEEAVSDVDNMTPFIYSVERLQNLGMLTAVQDCRVNVHAKYNGSNALMLAAAKGDVGAPLVMELLNKDKYRYNLFEANANDNNIALDYAIASGSGASIELIAKAQIEDAIKNGNIAVVRKICENYPDIVNFKSNGNNLLHIAAGVGQKDITEYLIQRGVNPCELNNDECAPFDIAYATGRLDVARLFVIPQWESEFDINNEVINQDRVRRIIDTDDNVLNHIVLDRPEDMPFIGADPIRCPYVGRFSALHVAVLRRNPEIVALLTRCNAERIDTNLHAGVIEQNGRQICITPLVAAILECNVNIVKHLVEDVDSVALCFEGNDNDDEVKGVYDGYPTPFEIAEQIGHPEIIEILRAGRIRSVADANARVDALLTNRASMNLTQYNESFNKELQSQAKAVKKEFESTGNKKKR